MKVAVVGAGGVGSVFGGRLAAAGHEVWLVHRRREVVDALRRDGLRLEGPRGDERIGVHATDAPPSVGPVDLVLILTKSTDTRAAAQAAACMLGEATMAVTLQNGLGNVETIAETVGSERVLLGMTYAGATVVAPGHVRHTAVGQTFLGEPDLAPSQRLLDGPNLGPPQRLLDEPNLASSEALRSGVSSRAGRLALAFSDAGLPTTATDRVWDQVWGKLLINSGMNAVCALTGASGETALRSAACREVLGLVAQETATVAAALGVALPYPDPAARVWQHCQDVGASRPSMLQDVERNRPTEIEAINGAIVREGARLGIPTPYNRALLLLIKAHEDIARG